MDKLLESVDKQASLACSVSSLIDFDQNLFQQFMQKNPVWDFHGVSREECLHKAKLRKSRLFYVIIIQWQTVSDLHFNLSFFEVFSNFLKLFYSRFAK